LRSFEDAALTVLVENHMVTGVIHGIIPWEDDPDEVRK